LLKNRNFFGLHPPADRADFSETPPGDAKFEKKPMPTFGPCLIHALPQALE
jgi:hypothetical protein